MKTITLTAVRPPTCNRNYTNPASQGSLIKRTRGWPQPKRSLQRMWPGSVYDCPWEPTYFRDEPEQDYEAQIPDDCEIGSMYVDYCYSEPWWKEFIAALHGRGGQQMGLNSLFENSTNESLCKAASIMFSAEVVEVQVVYYYNVASGYDCQRVDAIYKKRDEA